MALIATLSVSGAAAFAQEANVLQAPSGMQPARPVPQSLATPSSGSGETAPASAAGPQSIVPPGYGATTPSSAMPDAGPSGPSQFFPAGKQVTEPSVRVLSSIPGQSGTGIEMGTLSG
ncbi:MAG: hypothetical protein CVT73_24645, partial [Alphaproteobacteria bacterium HGW-Alphaproteobacteria-12]